MKRLFILSLLAITGCSTASSYSTSCFQENSDFAMAVNCAKQKMSNDPRAHFPINAKYAGSLYPFMDMITNDVETGKMSQAQGQYLIAEKINQLTNAQKIEWNELGTTISKIGQPKKRNDNKECTSISLPPLGSVGCKNFCINGEWAEVC